MSTPRLDITPRDDRFREDVLAKLREAIERIESGDLADATTVVIMLGRSDAYTMLSSAHLDTIRLVGFMEWAKSAALERLLGRGL